MEDARVVPHARPQATLPRVTGGVCGLSGLDGVHTLGRRPVVTRETPLPLQPRRKLDPSPLAPTVVSSVVGHRSQVGLPCTATVLLTWLGDGRAPTGRDAGS